MVVGEEVEIAVVVDVVGADVVLLMITVPVNGIVDLVYNIKEKGKLSILFT